MESPGGSFPESLCSLQTPAQGAGTLGLTLLWSWVPAQCWAAHPRLVLDSIPVLCRGLPHSQFYELGNFPSAAVSQPSCKSVRVSTEFVPLFGESGTFDNEPWPALKLSFDCCQRTCLGGKNAVLISMLPRSVPLAQLLRGMSPSQEGNHVTLLFLLLLPGLAQHVEHVLQHWELRQSRG